MATIQGVFRLGRDAELRYIPSGKAVCNLALASNYGIKDEQGHRATQWVDAVLWGERAEKAAQYLTKGAQLNVILSDPHIETYQSKDGSHGAKLVTSVLSFEFVGGGERKEQPAAPRAEKLAQSAQNSVNNSYPDDFDDDIPF